jgi:D-glycero-alpha-D-manno-heptose-7-phosphate kinase
VIDAVRVDVPVRVADVGGWTDTWFGSPGQVCHVAVGPGVRVEARRVPVVSGVDPVRVVAPAVGAPFTVGPDPDPSVGWDRPGSDREPLLAHAVASGMAGLAAASPGDHVTGIEVSITSAVPPGASLGTSASVVVGIVAAFDALVGDGRLASGGPAAVAAAAHQVETVRAGREAGVQDPWAAAFGGAQLLSINPYPSVARTAVPLDDATVAELDRRLVTVVFAPHDSSAVHGHVITDLVTCSTAGHDRARQALRRLSALAVEASRALSTGDVDRWAQALSEATEAQRRLRAELVGEAHDRAIAVAAATGAVGWKVNGAGGEGGSLTVLAADADGADRLRRALGLADPTWTVLELAVAPAGSAVQVLA